jgi:hypothetical protein
MGPMARQSPTSYFTHCHFKGHLLKALWGLAILVSEANISTGSDSPKITLTLGSGL